LRKHASGVQFTETVMGDGPAIKYGKVVTIKFTCKLPTSGHVVDQGERTFRYGSSTNTNNAMKPV
jgi:FKBP-type peptidyl-prolyl cis-trans isomerase